MITGKKSYIIVVIQVKSSKNIKFIFTMKCPAGHMA